MHATTRPDPPGLPGPPDVPVQPRRSRIGRVALAAALASIVAVAACGGGATTSAPEASGATDGGELTTAPTGGRLVYGVGYDVNTWSPFVERWLASGQVAAQAFYEPLATVAADGAVVPFLASAITPNAEFTEWTIDVREGIAFHDGAPLDAEAVALNLRTQGIGTPTNIAPINDVTAVEVTGPQQVVLRTAEPFATLPLHLTGQLGNQAGYMAAPSQIAAADPEALPIGTGPFIATDWEPGASIEGRRNPDYWRPGLPVLDAIEFRFLPDEAERLAELEAGSLDVAVFADSTVLDADGVADDPNLRVTTQDSDPIQRFVVLNAAVAPTDDPAVRRALATALDRDALAAVEGTGTVVSRGPLAADSPWTSTDAVGAHDQAAARAAVEAWESTNGPMAITLIAADDPASVRRQQAVADAWGAVGVDVAVEAVPLPRLALRVSTGEAEAAVFDKFAGVDPDTYAMFLLGTNVNPVGTASLNLAHLSSPALDDAVWSARATLDEPTRREVYATVEAELLEAMPYIWLNEAPLTVVASPRVRGLGEATLPDGSPTLPYLSGRHPMAELAIERR